MEALTQAGAEEITIVAGYLSQMLESYSESVIKNEQWSETNMVVSLAAAHSILEQHICLVSYSDIIFPAATACTVAQTPGDLVIAYDTEWERLWSLRFSNPLSDAETFRIDAMGRVTEIGRRPETTSEIDGQYMGLLKISPNSWHWIRELLERIPAARRNKLDMTGLLSQLVTEGRHIIGAPISGGWYEVDSRSDLELYESLGTPWLTN
jgi:choline kinase